MSIPGPWYNRAHAFDGLMLFATPTTLRQVKIRHQGMKRQESLQRPSQHISIRLPKHKATPTRSLYPRILKRQSLSKEEHASRHAFSMMRGKVTRVQRAQLGIPSRSSYLLAVKDVFDTWASRIALILAEYNGGKSHDFTCSRPYPAVIDGAFNSYKPKNNLLPLT
jgi:hypothetical protein